MIDADKLKAAMERPTIVLDEVTYTGRFLSHQEYYAWEDRFRGWTEGVFPSGDVASDIKAFFANLQLQDPDGKALSLERLLQEPKPVIEEALVDFFACQRRLRPAESNGSSTSAPDHPPAAQT